MTGGHTSKEGWADSHAVCYDTTKSCQTTRRDSRLRGATSPAEHVPPTLSRAVHMTQLLHKLCQPDRCDSKVPDLEKSFWPNSFLNSLLDCLQIQNSCPNILLPGSSTGLDGLSLKILENGNFVIKNVKKLDPETQIYMKRIIKILLIATYKIRGSLEGENK
jgi:hypothetical protein